MFYPIHLLPNYQPIRNNSFSDRWNYEEGLEYHKEIVTSIKAGYIREYSEDEYMDKGYYNKFQSCYDYRSIVLNDIKVDFKPGDNFKNIDFSYAEFNSCELKNATFFGNIFNFTNFTNCTFKNCTFVLNKTKGALFNNVIFVNCDFDDRNDMLNSECKHVKFQKCYFYRNIFMDCKFDPDTELDDIAKSPNNGGSSSLINSEIWAVYRGVKEAYAAGQSIDKVRNYYVKERKAFTKFNTAKKIDKCINYFFEVVTGYGVRPLRTLSAIFVFYMTYSLIYLAKFCLSKVFFISAGAFFTFGGDADSIKDLSALWKFIYISESFVGISMIALFITVLANVWLKDI